MTISQTALRTAVVTGGSTHIGRAIAEALAADGCQVYIASRNRERCVEVAAEIAATHGPCRGLAVDVVREESVSRLFNHVVEETGRLDVVVANAGGNPLLAPETPEATVAAETIRANLIGSCLTALGACRHMVDNGGGAIVFVSSIHGVVGADPGLYEGLDAFNRSGPGYHAAKGGVIQLARSLAAEHGRHGIRVNCVSPGVIEGPGIPAKLAERVAVKTPMGRLGTADEVASVVRFLSAADSAWVTGQNIVIDGGWTIW